MRYNDHGTPIDTVGHGLLDCTVLYVTARTQSDGESSSAGHGEGG